MHYNFSLPQELQGKEQIIEYSKKYSYKEVKREKELIALAKNAKKRGYLLKNEFLELCVWKSPRPKKRFESNDEDVINYITKTAFDANCPESIRINILTLLNGVKHRVASAILHMVCLEEGVSKDYPIMDFRALATLGYKMTDTDRRYEESEFWIEYTKYCRRVAQEYGVDLRTLDRALWQYSKERGG